MVQELQVAQEGQEDQGHWQLTYIKKKKKIETEVQFISSIQPVKCIQ